jgi:hypothetical protein
MVYDIITRVLDFIQHPELQKLENNFSVAGSVSVLR